MVVVGRGVEHALSLRCVGEFGRGGFAGGASGLVGEGRVGKLSGGLGGGQRGGRGGGTLERGVEDGDDIVDAAQATAVAEFLGRREAPWDFPEETSGEGCRWFERAEHDC